MSTRRRPHRRDLSLRPGAEALKTRSLLSATPLDLNPGPAGLNPSDLVAVGGTVYFKASFDNNLKPTSGPRLWMTNGLVANSRLVLGLNGTGFVGSTLAVGNALYVTVGGVVPPTTWASTSSRTASPIPSSCSTARNGSGSTSDNPR